MSAVHELVPRNGGIAVGDEIADLEIISVVSDPECATLQVRGEMDLANADLFIAVVDNHVGHGRRFFRIDLSRLVFLDCAGLQAIVQAHNRCLGVRGTLTLTGLTPRIALLLRVTQLDEALFIADELDRPPPLSQRPGHLSAVKAQ